MAKTLAEEVEEMKTALADIKSYARNEPAEAGPERTQWAERVSKRISQTINLHLSMASPDVKLPDWMYQLKERVDPLLAPSPPSEVSEANVEGPASRASARNARVKVHKKAKAKEEPGNELSCDRCRTRGRACQGPIGQRCNLCKQEHRKCTKTAPPYSPVRPQLAIRDIPASKKKRKTRSNADSASDNNVAVEGWREKRRKDNSGRFAKSEEEEEEGEEGEADGKGQNAVAKEMEAEGAVGAVEGNDIGGVGT